MSDTSTHLRRNITLPLLLFFGLGNILGAGIYVLIGKVAGEAGMFMPVAFCIAAIVAGLSALSYGEMSARYPYSAGVAVYLHEAFRLDWLSRLGGLLIAFAGMVSAATISRGFYGYFSEFIVLPEPLVLFGVILFLGALTSWGIKESVGAAAIITLIELGGLLLVIWAGSGALNELPQRSLELIPSADAIVWSGILLGSFLAFFAFIGFEDMVNIAEEVRDPVRTMPRAIILALIIATLIYALVALVAILILETSTLAASDAPLADVLRASGRIDPASISAIGMLAVINGALIQLIMASRVFYGMANRGWLWRPLANIHPRTQTPLLATALATAIILSLALFFPLETLAKGTSFLVLVVFALVNLALFVIKRREPSLEDGIDLPIWIPACGFISSCSLLLAQMLL